MVRSNCAGIAAVAARSARARKSVQDTFRIEIRVVKNFYPENGTIG